MLGTLRHFQELAEVSFLLNLVSLNLFKYHFVKFIPFWLELIKILILLSVICGPRGVGWLSVHLILIKFIFILHFIIQSCQKCVSL